MSSDEIEKLKCEKAELVNCLDKLLSYVHCMKLATQYKTMYEPDLMAIGRLVNRNRGEYCENKEKANGEKEVS